VISMVDAKSAALKYLLSPGSMARPGEKIAIF
jgi:hypothetical protein